MVLSQDVSLQPYNTFGISAKAAFFTEVFSLDELREALAHPGPKLFLGGGSNVLFTGDFNGLVVKLSLLGIEILRKDNDNLFVKVAAGESWHGLVLWSLANGLGGLENLSLIPGSVGASPMQNIGAYGVEIKDIFEELEAIQIADGQLVTFGHAACKFGYRESYFKHEGKGKYVITSVTFRLSKHPVVKTSYGDIQAILTEKKISSPTPKDVSEAVIAIRRSKLPDPAELGNAGSFFKNPEIPKKQYDTLAEQFTGMPGYPVSDTTIKVPAGWLIEQAGWKGQRFGNVGVHTRQALVLVNYGEGNGLEIKQLSQKIQASVFEKYGIQLQTEVNFV